MACALCSLIFFCAVTLRCIEAQTRDQSNWDRDSASLTTPVYVPSQGYPLQVHPLTTADGYILELHRIPHGVMTSSPADDRRPVVFIQDALFFTSYIWVMAGPSRALAFLLADAGYDVWLENTRGNNYSRRHTNTSVENADYWQFSVHERGIYDLPASIDYILNVTKQSDMFLIGMSRGPMTLFVMMSQMPEYSKKIRAAVAIGPIALLSPPQSVLIKLLASTNQVVQRVSELLDYHEFAPSKAVMQLVDRTNCERGSKADKATCELIIAFIVGDDSKLLNKRTIDYMQAVKPFGTSITELVHYGQIVASRKFRPYNHGVEGNLQRYGSVQPPAYNLSRVTCPVAVFVGDRDCLVTPQNIRWLVSRLPNVIGEYHVTKYNHVDFFEAEDVKTLVYDKILSLFKQFEVVQTRT